MNHTNIHVPIIAAANENIALLQSVEVGIKTSAISMPNCADDIVAPVVGDINLLLQSCCIISPATLMPMPVQIIAKRRGSLEITNISNWCILPERSSFGVTSITPTKTDNADSNSRINNDKIVLFIDLIVITPQVY